MYHCACLCAKSLSHIGLPVILWTVACQAPLHGILQAIILEWFTMLSSRGSPSLKDQTPVSCLLHWQVGSLPMRKIPRGDILVFKDFKTGGC